MERKVNIGYLFFFLVILFASVIVHEVAHAWMALRFGDTTARDAGRITLNPISHIDPFGTIVLPGMLFIFNLVIGGGVIFGWAKPVPINPPRFSNFRAGMFWVGSAGVIVNFVIAVVAGLAIRFFAKDTDSALWILFFPFVWVNLLLGVLNTLPLPPLDGSKILAAVLGLSPAQQAALEQGLTRGWFIILFFVVFFVVLLPLVFEATVYLFSLLTGTDLPS